MKNTTGKIERPVILAICGKSAAGKDSLATWLVSHFAAYGVPARKVISATSRPPREKETDESYYFMSKDFFERNIDAQNFLEYTSFRGWYYGLLKQEIKSNYINIVVVNPRGLENLFRYKYQYNLLNRIQDLVY